MSFDPVTALTIKELMVLSTVMTVASTAVSVIGGQQQAKAQAQQAQFQAQIARNNQIIANRAAEDSRKRGELEANQQRARTLQAIGNQRAALAAGGVVVDEGSAQILTSDTAGLGELDALTIRSNAEREALGFEAQGTNFGIEAQGANAAAANARRAGGISTFGTLASGFTTVADKWAGFKRQGLGPIRGASFGGGL